MSSLFPESGLSPEREDSVLFRPDIPEVVPIDQNLDNTAGDQFSADIAFINDFLNRNYEEPAAEEEPSPSTDLVTQALIAKFTANAAARKARDEAEELPIAIIDLDISGGADPTVNLLVQRFIDNKRENQEPPKAPAERISSALKNLNQK